MSGELRNRNVVVTGASAGVGRAAVHRFAGRARIGLMARDADALHDVKKEVEQLGGTAFVAPADVSNANEVFAAAAANRPGVRRDRRLDQ